MEETVNGIVRSFTVEMDASRESNKAKAVAAIFRLAI